MRLEELSTFVRELRSSYRTIGAVLPSSPALARALVHLIEEGPKRGGRRILEVGPGTGSLTREILRKLHPGDALDLCEANPNFVSFLRKRMSEDPVFRAHAGRITLHGMRVEDLVVEQSYDHVISALPLTNFDPELVERILGHLLSVVRVGGTLSYYEYVGMRRLGRVFSGAENRARLRGIDRVIENYQAAHEARSLVVLGNLPPAWVRTLRRRDASHSDAARG